MEFLEAVGKRRSIRWFKTWEQVPREKIQRILEVVRLTTNPILAHDYENIIRSFFINNGARVVTKPYPDVYQQSS